MSGQGRAGAVSRHKVGAIEIVSLGDGELDLAVTLFGDADPEERTRLARAAGLDGDTVPVAINTFAIRTAGRTLLVDAGSGTLRGPQEGFTGRALEAAGIAPDTVDAVLMTHMHGDHAGGLRLATGEAAFPRAELWLARAEAAYWSDPTLAGRMPDRAGPTIANAQGCMAAYADRIRLFDPGERVAPGVTAVALPGHTPGQSGFLVEDAGERLLIWADVVHVEAFQFARPEWTVGFDVDGAAAAATRARIFAEVAESGLPVAGMHLAFPGIGTVRREGGAYAFVAGSREA